LAAQIPAAAVNNLADSFSAQVFVISAAQIQEFDN
jgi:hypothetical protein